MFDAQQWLFESVFYPVMLWLDMGSYVEDGYGASAWFLWGALEIAVIACVLVPLQRWRPVEAVVDPASIRVDMFYTFIHRLGLFRLLMFLTLQPLLGKAFGALRAGSLDISTFHLDQVLPSLTDYPVVSFFIYLIALDFVGYWIHRAQHGLSIWWALHSLHHAQQQMTCWSDNRNHLLDDIVVDVVFLCVAFFIGVSPSQFVLIVVLTQLSESLQHANVRLSFGRIGEQLWVSPRFHRLHHSVSHGFGHHFGVLFPWWDRLFGTVHFEDRYDPTGVADQPMVDYGRGFLAQQWLGLKRMVRA